MTGDTEPGGLVQGTLQMLILKTLTLRLKLKRETRQWEAQATAIAKILAVTPGRL